jgi:hypothetical protein
VAEAQRREEQNYDPGRPKEFRAPPGTWMAELQTVMVTGDTRTRGLLVALNNFWHLQESLSEMVEVFRDLDEGLIALLPDASQIEMLARLGIAEFRRLAAQ